MKYLFILFSIIILSSCSSSLDPVEDPKKETTLQIQEANGDTVVLKLVDNYVYALQDGEVKYALKATSKDSDKELVHILYLFIFHAVFVLLFFLFLAVVTD